MERQRIPFIEYEIIDADLSTPDLQERLDVLGRVGFSVCAVLHQTSRLVLSRTAKLREPGDAIVDDRLIDKKSLPARRNGRGH